VNQGSSSPEMKGEQVMKGCRAGTYVLHMVMAMLFGAFVAVFFPWLAGWMELESGLRFNEGSQLLVCIYSDPDPTRLKRPALGSATLIRRTIQGSSGFGPAFESAFALTKQMASPKLKSRTKKLKRQAEKNATYFHHF
jgi:hypothetical protein